MYEDYPSEKGIVARVIGYTVLGVVVVGVILIALWAFGVGVAGIKGRGEARKQIQSADYRISAYNHFYDLCASVQFVEQNIAQSYEDLKTAPADDAARIRTNITGQLASRADAVAQYNADARKSYTIGQFRASDLPYELPLTYTKGTTTSCVSN